MCGHAVAEEEKEGTETQVMAWRKILSWDTGRHLRRVVRIYYDPGPAFPNCVMEEDPQEILRILRSGIDRYSILYFEIPGSKETVDRLLSGRRGETVLIGTEEYTL